MASLSSDVRFDSAASPVGAARSAVRSWWTRRGRLLGLGLACAVILSPAAWTADLTKEAETVGKSVSRAAQETWDAVSRRDPRRLSGGEMVAWLIVGAIVGAMASRVVTGKVEGFGLLASLFAGLGGAFLGGLIVDLAGLDFGWGYLELRLEKLAAAFLCAVILVFAWRAFAKRKSAGASSK